MKKIKLAILGAGNIARRMAQTVCAVPQVEPYAIASRDLARAEQYRAAYGFKKAFGSYAEMLADPAVDLVYIAVPHSLHCARMLEVLEAGKHVLCEKPFTLTAAQARQVTELAQTRGLFAGEAMWTRFLPAVARLQAMAASGAIGRITGASANIGYGASSSPRILLPEPGGGALLDIGIYPLTFLSLALGEDVLTVDAAGILGETGVDVQENITLRYSDGRMGTAMSTILARTDCYGYLYGENGYIMADDVTNPQSVRMFTGGYRGVTLTEEFLRPEQVTGFEYELADAAAAILAGRTESTVHPHRQIHQMMARMDSIRRSCGVIYPCEA